MDYINNSFWYLAFFSIHVVGDCAMKDNIIGSPDNVRGLDVQLRVRDGFLKEVFRAKPTLKNAMKTAKERFGIQKIREKLAKLTEPGDGTGDFVGGEWPKDEI